MTHRALAKALRRRQLRLKLQPKEVVHATPDEYFIEAYTVCSRCRQGIFSDPAAESAAVRQCDTVEQFVARCSEQLTTHICPAVSAPQN